MNINFSTLKGFCKGELACKLKRWILLGNEDGQIALALQQILKMLTFNDNEKCNVIQYQYCDISSDPQKLLTALCTTSLLQAKTIVVVKNCKENFPKEFEKIIFKNFMGILILIMEEIKKNSHIKSLAENDNLSVVIKCYKQDSSEVVRYIIGYLKEQKFTFDEAVPYIIQTSVPNNLLVVQNELEKLMLYKIYTKQISKADVEALVEKAGDPVMNKICYSFAIKEAQSFLENLDTAYNCGLSYMYILRVLQIYFRRLLYIKTREQQGESLTLIIQSLQPQVWGELKKELIKLIHDLSSDYIETTLLQLVEIEIKCKKYSFNPECMVEIELLMLTRKGC